VERARWSLEQHQLTFPEQDKRYVFDPAVVVFSDRDPQTRVHCAISREALDYHFKGDGRDKLEVFKANRPSIEELAHQTYLSGDTEADGSVADYVQGAVRKTGSAACHRI
jgi:hypothetical protein